MTTEAVVPEAPYCNDFVEWLKGDRKQQSPCGECAQAHSQRAKAEGYEKYANEIRRAANMRIEKAHGGK